MYKRLGCLTAMLFSLSCQATEPPAEYQLGRGFKFSDALIVGGYLASEFESNDAGESFAVDDLAVLVYGDITPNLSYMAELESAELYKYDFAASTEHWNRSAAIERLYIDYHLSDRFSMRVGKQIMPIGYWNLQPINVLRETTSNPVYSSSMFPKFLTGVDVYGYAPFDEALNWHFYVQATKDLDDSYINIASDRHYGLSVNRVMSSQWQLGGSIGKFWRVDGTEVSYLQANARFEYEDFTASMEGIVQDDGINGTDEVTTNAFFVQGEYALNFRHKIIARYERFKTLDLRLAGQAHQQIKTVGYSYRPVYPVSFKVEYQWHSDSANDRLLASFAVLF